MKKIVGSKNASDCDRTWESKALEIARALDSRQDEISKALEARPTSRSYRRVELPPTYAREAIVKFDAQPGWREEKESWDEIYKDYLQIKDRPTDRFWISLNSEVRSIIVDDQSRVNDSYTVSVDKDTVPHIEKTLQEIRPCVESSACAPLAFSPEVEAFVKSIDSYSSYWKLIQEETDGSKRQETAKSFAEQMKSDLEYLGFRANKSVTLKDGELILPLDPGPFAPSTELLSKAIESIWSSDSLKLKVQWVSANTSPDIFKLILGDTPGGRSFVRYKENGVHLFPDVRLKSIAHEIGHVLGFKDHYYTIWRPEKCSYVIQSNDGDLMSDPDTGVVTPEEWSELTGRYFSQKTP